MSYADKRKEEKTMSGSMTRREFVGSAVAGIVVGAGRKAYPKAAAGAVMETYREIAREN